MTDSDSPAGAFPLAITMGDALGIGPEIIAGAYAAGTLPRAVVVGSAAVLRRAAASRKDAASLSICAFDSFAAAAQNARADTHALTVYEPPVLAGSDLASLPWGQVDARSGLAAAHCIADAVRAVQRGQASAIVTAPIHKEALSAGGIGFPGHTEMLQWLATRSPGESPLAWPSHPPDASTLPPVRMMLANEELAVVLVTIHVSLRRAIEMLDVPSILQTIEQAHVALRRAGIEHPRIAVAGLNPHAGEGGLFGDEESRLIAPAIAAARAAGIDATGPWPPDTVFMRARRTAGRDSPFDVVVAMTHDHGLIAAKYLGVEEGVNVTLGLPFVRTSPDHGTAFDIAGRGVADPSSLQAAARRAVALVGAPAA